MSKIEKYDSHFELDLPIEDVITCLKKITINEDLLTLAKNYLEQLERQIPSILENECYSNAKFMIDQYMRTESIHELLQKKISSQAKL